MHPGEHATQDPHRVAVVMAESGATLSYSELEASANKLARLLRDRGLSRGSHLAILLDNNFHYYEVIWAALRMGVYVTPINWHLGANEVGYILEDCGAEAFVTGAKFAELVSKLDQYMSSVTTKLVLEGSIDGFESFEAAVAPMDHAPLVDPSNGAIMFYSSGTTGRPKGIKPPLNEDEYGTAAGMEILLSFLYGFTEQSRYLVPAPLYHAAPLAWSLGAQRLGCTVVVMEQFTPEGALGVIERLRVTHAQFVPTHFVRMLKLANETRTRFDHSTLELVIHAAAPCPVEVKQQMMAWWGPIIWEYYAGSEGNGYCSASPQEWLDHPGTVGRSIRGTVHVVSEEGDEVAVGETGQIWFDSGAVFEYHNDEAKTKSAFNEAGWSTLGDVGHLDAENFLFLTDRISHMIISGGVNIYPQEIENLLVMHPSVADVAVIGVPDEDLGEAVKAVVQLAPGIAGSEQLAQQIIEYSRANLAKFKCPRTVDFVDELPRLPSGKLLKRQLRQKYWPATAS